MDDQYEKDGKEYEEKFAQYLDEHGIPFLYISQETDQNKKGIRSAILRESDTKRPDFLVYLNTIGTILVDVKARFTPENKENSERSFYINRNDIEPLFSIQSCLLLPLWLAFVEKKKSTFYLVPISTLKYYKDRLEKVLEKDGDVFKHLFIRVPQSFCLEATQNLISVYSAFSFDCVAKEAERYKSLKKELETIVKDMGNNDVKIYCDKHKIRYLLYEEIRTYKKGGSL